MKRTALLATGSALALALMASSLPASADVHVLASIQKTKDITITERITINKFVNLDINALNLDFDAAAEADAILNQESDGNDVDSSLDQLEGDVELTDVNNFGIDLDATIAGSVNNNTGIVEVNQDVGNMANQGNQVALAIATPAVTANVGDPVFVNSQAEVEQINENNAVWHGEAPGEGTDQNPIVTYVGLPNNSADISGSINDNVGIVNVNQNAGNMNNQANSEALAVAINLAGVALSEAALGQVNVNPENSNGFPAVFEFGVEKSASLTGSLSGNVGVGGVNQAAGNMANQANVFSMSFIDGGGGVGIGSN